ncbi:Copper homeostasis protein CutC [Polaribacter huanghezhanensis]|uniref:copper homeostasis protein CutC n=1 Tax=Polaribacter huanghezhanensis TaxID=1354726 RepID=UPI00264708DD|nr:copper homeostasis protein CutC [Polaribacter huanghezhanensis]WKD87025.1 Copper homeostasis protein CutC [Polaribacter huanghezhanensis]
MLLEICANSYQSAINAEKAGANRIELCAELAVGGITPSYGLLKKVMNDLIIPVHVLIRPRSGDFTYSDAEFQILKEDILICKELGVLGIVSGVLHIDNTIDIERTKELVRIAKPMNFTFHRAFDWVVNPMDEIKNLEKIGVDRILTSGQKTSAEKGLNNLIKFQKATSKITIMPGGGINQQNIKLFQENGFKEVHLSATSQTKTIENPAISMNSSTHFDETQIATSDIEHIKTCLDIISNES